jgi:hypothetical protein
MTETVLNGLNVTSVVKCWHSGYLEEFRFQMIAVYQIDLFQVQLQAYCFGRHQHRPNGRARVDHVHSRGHRAQHWCRLIFLVHTCHVTYLGAPTNRISFRQHVLNCPR